ncbi:MAG TPA: 3-oxoacyl-[acyl-carrier-protein] reductase [Geminicoccaceae bacterium]|jgi:3-oxoacyl-[acyl-carrier protein] reductase|nr:3-oxoacyl-[acyl-carrier-protein] reductase [Geminicoccaceae bacterium]
MFDLSGRTALVTGASGGIGEAIARQLHAQGATLVLAGRRSEALAALAEALGERARVEVAELSDPQAAEQLIAAADNGGGPDVLINNAGLTRDNLAVRMKDEDWQTVLEVNLTAVFRLTRAALRGMMRRRWGRIVNVTSIVALTGNPGQVNYAAAKAGMIGMTKSLAAEVATRGITVNCVAPGFIETPMTAALSDDQRRRLLERVPVGRLGTPDDVAAAIGYLASQEAAYVTGQTLHVNGGMAMI